MELLSLKLIVLGISGGLRLFFGLVPLILFRSLAKNVSGKQGSRILKYVISVLMFFGGGVLLATCFLHMMPEVRSSFTSVMVSHTTDLPVPELIFIAGFFLVYLLEEAVHSIIHRHRRSTKKIRSGIENKLQFQQNTSTARSQNEFYRQMNSVNRTPNGIDLQRDFDVTNGSGSLILPRIRSPATSLTALAPCPNPSFCQIDPEWWRDSVKASEGSQLTVMSASGTSLATLDGIQLNTNAKGNRMVTPSAKSGHGGYSEWSPGSARSDDSDHSHFPVGMDEAESVAATIKHLLLVVAISFHGVFEGLAIGLQGTEKDVWALFIAVSLHECTILFCIGVELISAQTKVIRMITYITVVSLVSPLGIAIGIVISEHSIAGTVAQTLLVGSLQGLAAGTLLYVTFFEIFAAEGRKLHSKFIHILVAIIGFVMMASLEFLGGHGHGHTHGSGGVHGLHHSLNQTGSNRALGNHDNALLELDDDHDFHDHHHDDHVH